MTFGQQEPIVLTPEGERDRQLAVARGWVVNHYARREGCVACPRCAVLCDVYAALRGGCRSCSFVPSSTSPVVDVQEAPASDFYEAHAEDCERAMALTLGILEQFADERPATAMVALAAVSEALRETLGVDARDHDVLFRAVVSRMRHAKAKAAH